MDSLWLLWHSPGGGSNSAASVAGVDNLRRAVILTFMRARGLRRCGNAVSLTPAARRGISSSGSWQWRCRHGGWPGRVNSAATLSCRLLLLPALAMRRAAAEQQRAQPNARVAARALVDQRGHRGCCGTTMNATRAKAYSTGGVLPTPAAAATLAQRHQTASGVSL